MSKKNQSKKHKFKYTDPVAPSAVLSNTSTVPSKNSPVTAGLPVVAGRDFSYVVTDLKRLVFLAAGLTVLELGLWYLIGHSAVGPALYKLIQV